MGERLDAKFDALTQRFDTKLDALKDSVAAAKGLRIPFLTKSSQAPS